MRRLAVGALLLAGCAFDPGGLPIEGPPDLLTDDQSVPDADQPDHGPPPPDLHRVRDGIAPGETGWPCDTASECASGFCIDGFCCLTECERDASTCMACNVPGQEGRCVFVLDGTDPRGQCDQDPPTSCGRDGLCDGQGACRKWNPGTACGSSACANGSVTYAPACDGQGSCIAGSVAACYPYACLDATRCATDCTLSPTECATGVSCNNGTCGQRSDGQPCNVDGDCQSNHCAQGVCCASACSGTCFACNLPGKVGTCAAVPAGLDPLNQCTATSRTSCGDDGTCDGSGGCRLWKAGTPCSAPSCSGDTALGAGTCNGTGTCQPPATSTACSPYGCDPTNAACFTSCTSDMQCAPGKKCNPARNKCH
jgi:hypothetical protein